MDYLKAGASALALGGSIFSKTRLDSGEFLKIAHDLKKFLNEIKRYFQEEK